MKSLKLYSGKKYQWLFSLFTQRSIVMMFLKDIIKQDEALTIGVEVDAWRYVFEKDISKSRIIKNLIKSGIDNLVALEVVDKLNSVRHMIEEIDKQEKEN